MPGYHGMNKKPRYAALGAAPAMHQGLGPAQQVGPAAPVGPRQPGLVETLAQRGVGQLAQKGIEKAGIQAAATAAGGPAAGWLAGELGSMAPGIAQGLVGSFFNNGGSVFYRQQGGQMIGDTPIDGIPPEVMSLVQAYMSGQISQEEFVQMLMELGVPQEMIPQVLQVVEQGMSSGAPAAPSGPPGPPPGPPLGGGAPAGPPPGLNRGGMPVMNMTQRPMDTQRYFGHSTMNKGGAAKQGGK